MHTATTRIAGCPIDHPISIGGLYMQFTVNVQELLEGLNTVTRALAARPPKQILEGVLIEAE